MAKGLFTQGICILLRQGISLNEVRERLSGFEILGVQESVVDDAAPETLIVEYRPEAGGHLMVTPSSTPWPDGMGDPESSPDVFVAWSLGQFGPLAFPGGLQRAIDQCWGWEEAAGEVSQHTAHLRLLISYVLGNEEESDEDDSEDDEQDSGELMLIPDDYDPIKELQFLMRAVSPLLEMPEAICYFNPGGEVLRDENGLRQGLNYAWNFEQLPLEMWTNVRIFRTEGTWILMDVVGMGQLDFPDLEAVFDSDKYAPEDVERFLRNASLYMMSGDDEIDDGDTAEGPGDLTWSAILCDDSLSDPPRETIRWFPDDGSDPPETLMQRSALDDDDDDEPEDLDDEAF